MRVIDRYLSGPTGSLFHYTNTDGLQGIAKSCQIWATHVRHLNDSSEYYHALSLIEEAVKDILKTAGETHPTPLALDIIEVMKLTPLYVACFSQQRNLLSQWRAYCPNGGYSIGFVPDELSSLVGHRSGTFAACVYKEEDQLELVDAIATALIQQFPQKSLGTGVLTTLDSQRDFDRIIRCAALIKNKHFEEEEEWRFITSGLASFRRGRFGLTPYVSVALDYYENQHEGRIVKLLKCSNLTVGPSLDEVASLAAATAFGSQHLGLYLPGSVVPCKIPYRL